MLLNDARYSHGLLPARQSLSSRNGRFRKPAGNAQANVTENSQQQNSTLSVKRRRIAPPALLRPCLWLPLLHRARPAGQLPQAIMILPGQVEAVSHSKDILFTLVLKVGFAASLAALLLRFSTFRRILFTERRDSDQKVLLLLFLTPPLAIGIVLRLVGYPFFDLTLEGSCLLYTSRCV